MVAENLGSIAIEMSNDGPMLVARVNTLIQSRAVY